MLPVCGISSCIPQLTSRGNVVVVYSMRSSGSAQVLEHNVLPEIWMMNFLTMRQTTPPPPIEEWLIMVLCLPSCLDVDGYTSAYFYRPRFWRIIRRLISPQEPSIHVSASWVSRTFQHADHGDFLKYVSLTCYLWSNAFMTSIKRLIFR